MPNKSVHLTRGAGAPLAGKLRRYAGTLKARSALGSFALRARFPKTLRGKATVNPRNFGQPWIPAGERSGLQTRIATTVNTSVSLLCRHLVLDDAYDGHEDGAANPAGTDVGKNTLKIHPTAAGRSGSHYHVENCAAQSATDNSGDGIPKGAEAALFHRCAGNIAADSATD